MSLYDELTHHDHEPISLEEGILVKSLAKLRAATGQDLKVQEVSGRRARVVYPDYTGEWLNNHIGEYGLSFPVGEDGEKEVNYLCLGE